MFNISEITKTRDGIAVASLEKQISKYASEGKSSGRLYPYELLDKEENILTAAKEWAVKNGVTLTVAYDVDEMTVVDFSIGGGGCKDRRHSYLFGFIKGNH